jgi:hypothetical protein
MGDGARGDAQGVRREGRHPAEGWDPWRRVGTVTTDVTIRRAELVVLRRARILPRLAPIRAIGIR